jgi:hypothetical protein
MQEFSAGKSHRGNQGRTTTHGRGPDSEIALLQQRAEALEEQLYGRTSHLNRNTTPHYTSPHILIDTTNLRNDFYFRGYNVTQFLQNIEIYYRGQGVPDTDICDLILLNMDYDLQRPTRKLRGYISKDWRRLKKDMKVIFPDERDRPTIRKLDDFIHKFRSRKRISTLGELEKYGRKFSNISDILVKTDRLSWQEESRSFLRLFPHDIRHEIRERRKIIRFMERGAWLASGDDNWDRFRASDSQTSLLKVRDIKKYARTILEDRESEYDEHRGMEEEEDFIGEETEDNTDSSTSESDSDCDARTRRRRSNDRTHRRRRGNQQEDDFHQKSPSQFDSFLRIPSHLPPPPHQHYQHFDPHSIDSQPHLQPPQQYFEPQQYGYQPPSQHSRDEPSRRSQAPSTLELSPPSITTDIIDHPISNWTTRSTPSGKDSSTNRSLDDATDNNSLPFSDYTVQATQSMSLFDLGANEMLGLGPNDESEFDDLKERRSTMDNLCLESTTDSSEEDTTETNHNSNAQDSHGQPTAQKGEICGSNQRDTKREGDIKKDYKQLEFWTQDVRRPQRKGGTVSGEIYEGKTMNEELQRVEVQEFFKFGVEAVEHGRHHLQHLPSTHSLSTLSQTPFQNTSATSERNDNHQGLASDITASSMRRAGTARLSSG